MPKAQPTITLTARVPADLAQRAQEVAYQRRLSVSDLLRQGLEAILAQAPVPTQVALSPLAIESPASVADDGDLDAWMYMVPDECTLMPDPTTPAPMLDVADLEGAPQSSTTSRHAREVAVLPTEPPGLTAAEVARLTGFTRRDIHNDLRTLMKHQQVTKLADGRYVRTPEKE